MNLTTENDGKRRKVDHSMATQRDEIPVEGTKKKRSVLKLNFPDVDEILVDADDWKTVRNIHAASYGCHCTGSAGSPVICPSVEARIAKLIDVDPYDKEKRVTAFRFARVRGSRKVALNLSGISNLDRLTSLELKGVNISAALLTGLNVSTPIPGAKSLVHLRQVKLNLFGSSNDRNFDLIDGICRLPNLEILDVSGFPYLLTYLISEQGLEHRGPDLEELYLDWDLEIRNLNQPELKVSPKVFVDRFENLRTLELGPCARHGGSMHGCWTSGLEKLSLELLYLIEVLRNAEAEASESFWCSNVRDLTVYVQAPEGALEKYEASLSFVFQKVAQCMRSLRRLCLVFCNFHFDYGFSNSPRQRNYHYECFAVPLSKLHPLSSTLEDVEVFASYSVAQHVSYSRVFIDYLDRFYRTRSVERRLIPKIQMEDIRHLSSLKNIKFTNCMFGSLGQSSSDCSQTPKGKFPVLHHFELNIDEIMYLLLVTTDLPPVLWTESPWVNFAPFDLSQLRVFRAPEFAFGYGEDIPTLMRKIFSECPRLEIFHLKKTIKKNTCLRKFVNSGKLADEIIACPSKRLRLIHFGSDRIQLETPKQLWEFLDKFPYLGNFSWCAPCLWSEWRSIYRLMLNRMRWRMVNEGIPSAVLWPHILDRRSIKKIFQKYPEDKELANPFTFKTFLQHQLEDADRMYMLLREFGVGKIFVRKQLQQLQSSQHSYAESINTGGVCCSCTNHNEKAKQIFGDQNNDLQVRYEIFRPFGFY